MTALLRRTALVVLLPTKARIVGDWIVVDPPRHYKSKEASESEEKRRAVNGEEESAKHAQHAAHSLEFLSDR